ncbi:MAG: DNA gyrase subunit A [Patescibacteria group bacterium]|uniref:DNA gyrase subunit A n=1 Tax=candidate division WWE3 bacterium TaxID=2053526 RepID=A0A955ED77_UNCKA|nr:DNA gyrase subunit A [candidate division WWE3 bacterium]
MADDNISNLVDENNESTTPDNNNLGIKNNNSAVKGVVTSNIADVMQKAYLDYAMSVIVSRALPDVRDGLKPVHRRIIHAMQDQSMYYNAKYKKSAAVVGEVLGKYHPHSDTSVYDAMVRMAQDFTLRYPLIDGQGNFGSIDNDPPAAMRYTEARLQKISEELYGEIKLDTVDFELNDLQNYEPKVLPATIPNLLLNGAQGIAVGMATQIPPHNLTEVINGLKVLIEKADKLGTAPTDTDTVDLKPFENHDWSIKTKVAKTDFSSEATLDDLLKEVKGPDFPTGATIYDQKEIVRLYATGRGRIVTRSKVNVEESKSGKIRLIVTEIPYMQDKSALISKIADLAKAKKVQGISDLRDESNKKGMRIVIELKKDATPKKVENNLYKYTPLQQAFNGNMVALVHGEPKLLGLKTILEEFVKHRQVIVVRRTLFKLNKAKAREHILEGLNKAIDAIDEIIALIRASKDQDAAREGLMSKFGFTIMQAQAILDMQLRRLAALERQKIVDELQEIRATIEGFESLLQSPQLIIKTIVEELEEAKSKYGDERRTKVVKGKVGELSDEDLVADEKCIVTISKGGYIKRMHEDTYKKQGRGGKGVSGATLKEEDVVDTIRICNTHDTALFFTNKGKVYKLRVWDIPEFSRTAKGTAMVNFLNITQNEKVEAFLPLTSDILEDEKKFIVLGTEKGTIKKTSMKDFANIRTNGIMAVKLADDDDLSWAKVTGGNDEILLITSQGQSIRFHENKVRPMGRAAAGVIGIKFAKSNDKIIGMNVIPNGDDKDKMLIVVTEKGFGKKTPISEYKTQNRGGSGILTYKVADKTGNVVTARLASAKTKADLLIISQGGQVIRVDEKQVPKLGRATLGVKLIRLSGSDVVASTAFIIEDDEEPQELGE